MSRCVQFLNICTYITVGFLVVWMPIPISSSNSTSKWSLMIGQCEKYGYNFFSPMSFWENANLVFWPCQNSWFWGWKNFFSIAIFHKNHFAYYVLEPFLHQKALKQSICLILAFCATVAQNLWQKMTNTLFESFLVKKWSWLIVTKLNIFKNGNSKKNFSDPKSAVLTWSKHKIGIFSKGHWWKMFLIIFLTLTNHKWSFGCGIGRG